MKPFIFLVMTLAFFACNAKDNKTKETKPAEIITDTVQKTEPVKPVAEQLYACEMHPEVIGKKDEKCPKCGMKLTVPVKQ
jgi:hypothetical protein